VNLSPHFTLRELTRTNVRGVDNTPIPDDLANLTRLAIFFLEPVRAKFGPLWVTSGFRCWRVNKAIGGSQTSAHMAGRAADFVPLGPWAVGAVVEWIVDESGLEYDQVIEEHTSTDSWIHLGIAAVGALPRKEALVFNGGEYDAWRRVP